jgi:hypothetical protein
MTEAELMERLRGLTQKWISKARHPQRMDKPEVRAAIMACVNDLQALLAEARDAG